MTYTGDLDLAHADYHAPKIDYRKPAKIDFTHPARQAPAPLYRDGVRVLRKGETVVLCTVPSNR